MTKSASAWARRPALDDRGLSAARQVTGAEFAKDVTQRRDVFASIAVHILHFDQHHPVPLGHFRSLLTFVPAQFPRRLHPPQPSDRRLPLPAARPPDSRRRRRWPWPAS